MLIKGAIVAINVNPNMVTIEEKVFT